MKEKQEVGSSFEQERRRKEEFPSDLEGRLNVILASFNAEPKAVTLLLLSPSFTDSCSLVRMFREKVANSETEKAWKATAPTYCSTTLSWSGLVAKKETGFSLTETGAKYGRPLAAFFLWWAVREKQSFFPILGSTHSPGESRAPLNRFKILCLLGEGERREIDLIQELEMASTTVGKSLEALAKAGIVDYQAVQPHTARFEVSYEVNEEFPSKNIQKVGTQASLTQK